MRLKPSFLSLKEHLNNKVFRKRSQHVRQHLLYTVTCFPCSETTFIDHREYTKMYRRNATLSFQLHATVGWMMPDENHLVSLFSKKKQIIVEKCRQQPPES